MVIGDGVLTPAISGNLSVPFQSVSSVVTDNRIRKITHSRLTCEGRRFACFTVADFCCDF